MNGNTKNIIGQKYGKLTVIQYSHSNKNGSQWICKCDCGNYCVAPAHGLKTQHKLSCGCLSFTASGFSNDRFYQIWKDMKRRCYNPKCKSYLNYGGRGILICDEWKNNFLNFRSWALSSDYEEGLTIDRIDNNSNYSPSNCKWSTYKEQENNTRNNHIIAHGGVSRTVAQWAEFIGISDATMRSRVRRAWSMERIIETPQQMRFLR